MVSIPGTLLRTSITVPDHLAESKRILLQRAIMKHAFFSETNIFILLAV